MNDILREMFRHSAWATRQLIEACRGLTDEQLNTPYTGSYGSILSTFNHLIAADASYLNRLSGGERAAWIDGDKTDDFNTLAAWADESASGWEQYLSREIDGEKLHKVDRGAHEVHASIIITQAIFHANIHREQICTTLTSYGSQPPEIQPREYALDTGRMWATAAER
jgi:uncharacterized damage-inducible protein DinB